jgi:hypothetical protein
LEERMPVIVTLTRALGLAILLASTAVASTVHAQALPGCGWGSVTLNGTVSSMIEDPKKGAIATHGELRTLTVCPGSSAKICASRTGGGHLYVELNGAALVIATPSSPSVCTTVRTQSCRQIPVHVDGDESGANVSYTVTCRTAG